MRAKSGFTLVEILIVVVILGILAAIVIPQFTDASTEARTSSLCSDLQTLRSQIELYKIQHSDSLAAITDDASFIVAMTKFTDIKGVICAEQKPGDGRYGPYVSKIPKNPFNDKSSVRVEIGASTAGTDADGWVLNTDTGVIQADDALSCSDGTPHTDL